MMYSMILYTIMMLCNIADNQSRHLCCVHSSLDCSVTHLCTPMIKGYAGLLSHSPFMASYEQANIIRTSMRVRIKASKTDKYRKSAFILICKSGTSTCPHNAMCKYLKHCTTHKGSPLFTFRNGNYLTRRDVSSMTKSLIGLAGVNPANYSSHSYIIGAATTAAAASIPESLIQFNPRWRSTGYKTYIHSVLPREYAMPPS